MLTFGMFDHKRFARWGVVGGPCFVFISTMFLLEKEVRQAGQIS